MIQGSPIVMGEWKSILFSPQVIGKTLQRVTRCIERIPCIDPKDQKLYTIRKARLLFV